MARNPRYTEPNSLVEVTVRCIQGRYLLRPSPELNDVFVGVLGKGQAMTGLPLVGTVALSSHYHLLAVPKDQEQLSRFMCFVNSNLSKEVGRLHNWSGTLWEARYRSIPVDNDETAQVARLRYLLSQGVKECLVKRPEEWPGVHCAKALHEGQDLIGRWFDRTKLYRKRIVEGKEVTGEECSEEVRLRFIPLPCWADCSPADYRSEVGRMIDEIVLKGAEERQENGGDVLGAQAVSEQDPHHSSPRRAKSPAPLFHASTEVAYRALYKAFSLVFAAYRLAAEKLRSGYREVEFPEGTFPCSRSFVPFECRGDPA